MGQNGKNPAQSQFSSHEMETIDEITITIGILLESFKKIHRKNEDIIQAFSTMSTSKRILAQDGLTLHLWNMNQGVGIFPDQINRELARILVQGTREAFLDNPSTLTKILSEFANKGILESIKTKKEIKNKSPKSFSNKPKAREGKRVGYPVVYRPKGTVEDYKKLLSKPEAVGLIHERLLRHGVLREAYDIFSKRALYAFKRGDRKFYDFLSIFAEAFPNLDRNSLPNPDLFREAINLIGEEELEELRKMMVDYLLENPSGSIFFIFSLAKFKATVG